MKPPADIVERGWKPGGGLWTSTLDAEGSSGWERWCRSEEFRLEKLRERWLLEPVEARVFAIREPRDVDRLMSAYGVSRYDELPELQTLAWEELAADWDALWLSSPWIDMGGMPLRLQTMLFYGWDCESTWWARWRFDGVRRLE